MDRLLTDMHRILVIDHDPDVHEGYRRVLDEELHQVHHRQQPPGPATGDRDVVPVAWEMDSVFSAEEGVHRANEAATSGRPFAVAFIGLSPVTEEDCLQTVQQIWQACPDLLVVLCDNETTQSWSNLVQRIGSNHQLLLLKRPLSSIEFAQMATALSMTWSKNHRARRRESDLEQLVDERTQRMQVAESSLKRKTELLELAASIAKVGHWRFELDSGAFAWSPTVYEIFGVAPDEFDPTPKSTLSVVHASDRHRVMRALRQAVRGKSSVEFKAAVQTPADGLRHVLTKAVCELGQHGEAVALFGVTQDITEQEQALIAVKHANLHDPLTNLPNRAKFNERLIDAIRLAKRNDEAVALILVDLDHFKQINDAIAHGIGDELLVCVAKRLARNVRETDTVARLSGDEFGIIQTIHRDPEEISVLLRRIQKAIGQPFELRGHCLSTSVSMGISMAPHDGTEPHLLLKNADLALHKAKSDGRGVYRFFETELDQRMRARRRTELDFKAALTNGQLQLYYQPMFRSDDQSLCVLEALARWRHPERGIISPQQFISVAEETGMIVEMGHWAIAQACADASTWPDQVRVAVNVSARQFRHGSLVPSVIAAFQASGIRPDRLELEITETVLLGDTQETIETLHELRKLGVRIVMDDFGVGYSSLSYLRSFPFHKLKLDRSFVYHSTDSEDARAIIRAVASLGQSLGIETTAEGVETHEQLERVVREGYSQIQGFLFDRPLPLRAVRRKYFQHGADAEPVAISMEI